MPEVAIIGDTHVPSREPEVPDWVKERVEAADRTIHVGDFEGPDVLATVEEHAGDLTAVHGNVDPEEIDLPAVATLDVEGVRFVVTHGTGSPNEWHDRVAETAREHAGDGITVGVGGHVHQVIDEEYQGLRVLNPGSATGADPATEATMLTVQVDGDALAVEVNSR